MTKLLPSLALLSILPLAIASAQNETPIQTELKNVEPSAQIRSTRGDIMPIFWKAKLGDSSVMIPIRSIEFFGVQNYEVDGVTVVRELTISTDSNNLIRIYHIRPIDLAGQATNTLETLRRVAEGTTGEELDRPVKIFPQTTHAHMVEYRVEEESHVSSLYEHLESVMIEYHARDLIQDQRPETVREVKISD